MQASDIPAKVFKQNNDIFVNYICTFFKKCIDQGNFLFVPKHDKIMLVFNESCILWNNLYKHFMEQFVEFKNL